MGAPTSIVNQEYSSLYCVGVGIAHQPILGWSNFMHNVASVKGTDYERQSRGVRFLEIGERAQAAKRREEAGKLHNHRRNPPRIMVKAACLLVQKELHELGQKGRHHGHADEDVQASEQLRHRLVSAQVPVAHGRQGNCRAREAIAAARHGIDGEGQG